MAEMPEALITLRYNVCAECKWWDMPSEACSRQTSWGALFSHGNGDCLLFTEGDFGCIQWEAR